MIAVLGVDARQQSRGQIHLAYNINNVMGLVADIGGYANTRINDRLLTYMLGPRFGWLAFAADAFRAIPVRGAYGWNDLNTASTTQNAFAMASGGNRYGSTGGS